MIHQLPLLPSYLTGSRAVVMCLAEAQMAVAAVMPAAVTAAAVTAAALMKHDFALGEASRAKGRPRYLSQPWAGNMRLALQQKLHKNLVLLLTQCEDQPRLLRR